MYFFRQVVGVAEITKEVLSRRTNDYQHWVAAFACNHSLPIAWAEKGVRKQDDLRPHLRRMEKRQQYGVYFILKSMEQGSTFRSTHPSTLLSTLTTASWLSNAAALPTTTSISATRCWGPW